MRPTLQNLIETAQDLRVYFEESHFELYGYEEDAYVDLYVGKAIKDLSTLLRLLNGHEVSVCPDDNRIRIRIYEKPFE